MDGTLALGLEAKGVGPVHGDLAVALATDKSGNRQLRRKIKSRSRALFEDINAVKELEGFFEWSINYATA